MELYAAAISNRIKCGQWEAGVWLQDLNYWSSVAHMSVAASGWQPPMICKNSNKVVDQTVHLYYGYYMIVA